MGRKRRFFPTPHEVERWASQGVPGDAAKAGLNHRIQGAVVDIMNLTLIAILNTFPDAVLHLHSHDGAFVGFPDTLDPHDVVAVVSPLIARVWEVEGVKVPITASGALVFPTGCPEKVRFTC